MLAFLMPEGLLRNAIRPALNCFAAKKSLGLTLLFTDPTGILIIAFQDWVRLLSLSLYDLPRLPILPVSTKLNTNIS